MLPFPDAAEKGQSSYFGEAVYLQNNCTEQKAYFLSSRFGISRGHRKIANAGQACHRRGTSGLPRKPGMDRSERPSLPASAFTGVGAREAGTTGQRSDDLPSILNSNTALVLLVSPLVRASSLTC